MIMTLMVASILMMKGMVESLPIIGMTINMDMLAMEVLWDSGLR